MNELRRNHIVVLAVEAWTMFLCLADVSTPPRQQQAVGPSQGRTSLDRKAVVFHKIGAWGAARRIGGVAGLLVPSAY